MSHAKAFVESHRGYDPERSNYDTFISELLSQQPEGTKAHSAPEGNNRTIYTFPDNTAAHVLNTESDPEAFECEEDAETMLAYLEATLGGEGGKPKPEGGDENDEDEDENEDEDEEAMA